jgi:hypothetical protein
MAWLPNDAPLSLGMSDSFSERDQYSHPQANDRNINARLCAETVDVANLINPRHDAVKEPKGNDVLGAYNISARLGGEAKVPPELTIDEH